MSACDRYTEPANASARSVQILGRGVLAVLATMHLVAGSQPVDAAPTRQTEAGLSPQNSAGSEGTAVLTDSQASGPYCGVYSLLACLRSVGIEVDIRQLWTVEFIGSVRGSSAAELVRAAEGCGASAVAFKNLGPRELARSTTPMLIHLRSNWSNADYNHWVAFLGFEGDHVRIIDPPHPTHTLSLAELLAGWDGLAIAISRRGHVVDLVGASRRAWALAVVAADALVLLVRPSLVRLGAASLTAGGEIGWRRLGAQGLGIVFFAAAVAGVWRTVDKVGFFRNRFVVAEVQHRYYSVRVPVISREEFEQVVGAPGTVIFDARLSKDFQRGAIPDAIKFPVNAKLPERRELLRRVHPGDQIVVYCQSAGCPFSDKVAQFLRFNGCSRVAIYRGGYREWRLNHPSVQREQTPVP